MHPTLVGTQHVIASKVAYLRIDPSALMKISPLDKTKDNSSLLVISLKPVHGDVVAIAYPKDPSQDLVKRVIGIPGDVIE